MDMVDGLDGLDEDTHARGKPLYIASHHTMADQTATDRPVLYAYFRSSCSWRVRAALNWKNIDYQYKAVDLVKGEQKSVEYEQLNPQKQVPTLIIDGHVLTQSTSILEYLEETRPERPLLPKDPFKRSQVQHFIPISGTRKSPNAYSLTASCPGPHDCGGDQRRHISASESRRSDQDRGVGHGQAERMGELLDHKGSLLEKTAGTYSVGDEITMADCLLIPMVYNAIRYGVDMTRFPNISRINSAVSELESFRRAHAHMQEDCLPELAGKL
ncbi:hypothetical protein BC937DRAFT_90717 [Endogone sp. FLAS-F59071]|nr:hypothetical protein BC937DRAFT_90717 [Endogone sp. FLAS-F59071]|eukprot:RUS21997.1 hypothetical protein BC937DRAFT_90717 [Endogone sp. FLAS-F59071]